MAKPGARDPALRVHLGPVLNIWMELWKKFLVRPRVPGQAEASQRLRLWLGLVQGTLASGLSSGQCRGYG